MAGWAAGADRQSRRQRRAAPEGPKRSGGPGTASLRHASAGLEGSDAHPASSSAGGKTPRPRSGASLADQRAALPSASGAASKPLSRIRSAVVAACARARVPAAATPSGRIERATRKTRKLRTLAVSQKPASARSAAIAFRYPAPPGGSVPRTDPASATVTRMGRDAPRLGDAQAA
jgi:hypothetical protein